MKLIVAIEVPFTKESLTDLKDDWFPLEDKGKIIVDEACLRRSLADDSFYAFEFLGVKE